MNDRIASYKEWFRIMSHTVGLRYQVKGGSQDVDGLVIRFATREDARAGVRLINDLLPNVDCSYTHPKQGEIKHADEAVTDPMYVNVMLSSNNQTGHAEFHKFVQRCENPATAMPAARDVTPMKIFNAKTCDIAVPVEEMLHDKQFDIMTVVETPKEAEDRLRKAARFMLEANRELGERN